jgi:hypothetical protein
MTQIYDPRNMEWSYWNALIAEKYEAQQLMWPVPEERWKDFALSICSIALFSNYGVPTPDGFDRWQDWAFAFNNAVN